MSSSTATRTDAGATQNVCRWRGDLPPAVSTRPRWKPHAARSLPVCPPVPVCGRSCAAPMFHICRQMSTVVQWLVAATEHNDRPDLPLSGRTYPKLARIVRALCAVAGRCWQPLAAAVAVTVAVSGWSCSPSPRSARRCDRALSCPGPPPNPIAAEPDGRRVLSRGGVANHE